MSLERPEFVSDLVIYLLNELGVEYAPLNPGATIRGLHESVVNYGNCEVNSLCPMSRHSTFFLRTRSTISGLMLHLSMSN